MAANPKTLLPRLMRSGPHRVVTGDLGAAGLPGLLFAPKFDGALSLPPTGGDLPAVVFAHDWTTHPKRYQRTLRHLASWGFVVAAPNTERGFFASDRAFAADLRQALEIVGSAKLGNGQARVSPKKLGIVGHGFGASAAVLAGAGNSSVSAIAALWPAKTTPAAIEAATEQAAPGLVLTTPEEEISLTSNAAELALNWGGDVVLRAVPGFPSAKLPERRGPRGWFELDLAAARPRVHAHLAGWLLAVLAKDKESAAFADPDAVLPGIASLDATAVNRNTVSSVRALLG